MEFDDFDKQFIYVLIAAVVLIAVIAVGSRYVKEGNGSFPNIFNDSSEPMEEVRFSLNNVTYNLPYVEECNITNPSNSTLKITFSVEEPNEWREHSILTFSEPYGFSLLGYEEKKLQFVYTVKENTLESGNVMIKIMGEKQ